ncbi:uncharacterized protein FSUBG_9112 [Fusarium subglutinans]|uniref:Uncharacterized protein n=1 Tax=Gibberella subglutinans TaxID=42677 RepID=A0A8H5PF02_GIBSU|nr:uncharacterized protein FSUBG_9112 [Fusarium subglutinans]KAF5595600.1 hypothetical protein FSUBG_9112 [Fusarium subglutinans]
MNYDNGFFTVCILAFSTTVCILGLILGVVFIFFQRQRDEQLLDDIYDTVCAAVEASYDAGNCNCANGEQRQEKTSSSSIARHSGRNKNNKIPNGGAY